MLIYRRVSPSQLPLVIKHCLLEKPPFSSMIFAANQTSHVWADFPATNLAIFTDTGGYIPTLSQCSLSHFIKNSLSFSIIYHRLLHGLPIQCIPSCELRPDSPSWGEGAFLASPEFSAGGLGGFRPLAAGGLDWPGKVSMLPWALTIKVVLRKYRSRNTKIY